MEGYRRTVGWSAWKPRALVEFIGYALFFTCVVFPMVRPLLEFKAALFSLLLFALVLHALWAGHIKVHSSVALWLFGIVSVGALFSLEGVITDAPGALAYGFAIFVFWILVYALLLGGVTTENVLWLYWIALGSTIFISLNGLFFVLSQIGLVEWTNLPDVFGWEEDEAIEAFGATEGYIRINVLGINSMPFLVPMVLGGIAMIRPGGRFEVLQRTAEWLALLLGLLFVFISGRLALLLVTLLSPVLLLFFLRVRRNPARASRTRIITTVLTMCVIGVAIASYLNTLATDPYSLTRVWEILTSGFGFSALDVKEIERQEQFYALLNGWSERPLIGWGLGASAGAFGSISSPEYPWSYELFYLALLFQVGLLGFMTYLALLVWIYWMGLRVVQSMHPLSGVTASFLVGMTCFLAASGTNPYLPRFDGLWIFLLPIACINLWLCDRPNTTHAAVPGRKPSFMRPTW